MVPGLQDAENIERSSYSGWCLISFSESLLEAQAELDQRRKGQDPSFVIQDLMFLLVYTKINRGCE